MITSKNQSLTIQMKPINIFIVSLLIFTTLPQNAWSYQSSIFNFSSKKIYYSLTNPSQTGKISPFKSKNILYYDEKTKLNIYTSIHKQNKTCHLEITERLDTFVTNKHKDIKCTLRAERLPKEF